MHKKDIRDLAILGGPVAFPGRIHVGRPNIGDRRMLQERIDDILDRCWLTNAGRYVKEFEAKTAALLGVKHCVAMCNCTVALEIAIRALDLTGEVIVPSFTFVATPNSLFWQGIQPIFCDIDPATHNIDPACIERMITPRTTGIIGVHLWGRPCNVEALTEIARRRGLKLLFDSAHAFGCSCKGRMIGGFGDAEIFSFHATKFVNAMEGGVVATNDSDMAEKMRYMKNFGFADYDRTDHIGINGKMNEMSAAMGLTNIEAMPGFAAVNFQNYLQYRRELADIPGISIITYDEKEQCNFQYIIIEIDEVIAGVSRDTLVQVLHAEGVLARRYFYPGCHRMEPYRSHFPNVGLVLPETERLSERVLCLPTGTAVQKEAISAITDIIRVAVSYGRDLNSRIPPSPKMVAAQRSEWKKS